MSIWKFFAGSREEPPATRPRATPPSSPETETVRRIIEALDRLEPERARYIAAFAYILGRVAHADRNISPEETQAMERIVIGEGRLPEEQAILVVQMARSQNVLFGGTENFLVTREFKKIATREQKIALLHCLFAVSSSDESISTLEDNEIRKISRELEFTHDDFIAVRLAHRRHLAVLKKPAKPKKT
jgi:uncharacterized tellurite resistance protein B-like protein